MRSGISSSAIPGEDAEEHSKGDEREDVSLMLSRAQVVRGESQSKTLLSGYQMAAGSGISYGREQDEEVQLVEELES